MSQSRCFLLVHVSFSLLPTLQPAISVDWCEGGCGRKKAKPNECFLLHVHIHSRAARVGLNHSQSHVSDAGSLSALNWSKRHFPPLFFRARVLVKIRHWWWIMSQRKHRDFFLISSYWSWWEKPEARMLFSMGKQWEGGWVHEKEEGWTEERENTIQGRGERNKSKETCILNNSKTPREHLIILYLLVSAYWHNHSISLLSWVFYSFQKYKCELSYSTWKK